MGSRGGSFVSVFKRTYPSLRACRERSDRSSIIDRYTVPVPVSGTKSVGEALRDRPLAEVAVPCRCMSLVRHSTHAPPLPPAPSASARRMSSPSSALQDQEGAGVGWMSEWGKGARSWSLPGGGERERGVGWMMWCAGTCRRGRPLASPTLPARAAASPSATPA